MTLHITPHMLEAAYTLLQSTPPFSRWKLPLADDVEFRVTRGDTEYGACQIKNGVPVMEISFVDHGTLGSLIVTLAHEMIHLKMRRDFPKEEDHGERFQKYADSVCRAHGFDRRAF